MYWAVPVNFPTGNYSVRRTDSTGSYISPPYLKIIGFDYSPCTTPYNVPVTLSNVTAIQFSNPYILERINSTAKGAIVQITWGALDH
ncbi:hypothetical protein HK096_000421, partial [Nowakowskiella sp. JEL0078]